MESGCYLCDDLLIHILLRLPSKSLLRFKTVSKSWRSLIADPLFLKKSPKLIIYNAFSPRAFFSSDMSSPGNIEKLELPEEFNWVMKTAGLAPVPVGSCNGLLLLKTFGPLSHLWMANVSTREFHFISIPENRLPLFLKYTSYGFGYDSVNDDYKVVVVWSCSYESNLPRYANYTSVYSLRNNAWSSRDDKNECPVDGYIKGTFGVLVGGKLHWIAYSELNGDPYVIAFDFCSEEFEKIAALPEAENVSARYGSLRELGGCVAVTEACKDVYCSVSVWVLKESGWVRLLRSGIDDTFCEIMIPLAYSKTGNEVLLHNLDSCVWYSKENGKTDIVIDRGCPFHVITCLDSLVRISDYRRSHRNRGIE